MMEEPRVPGYRSESLEAERKTKTKNSTEFLNQKLQEIDFSGPEGFARGEYWFKLLLLLSHVVYLIIIIFRDFH